MNECDFIKAIRNNEYKTIKEKGIKLVIKGLDKKDKEIERLEEENDIATEKVKSAIKEIKRLNKCYCERTDCAGRIKNSAKFDSVQEENERLNNIINEMEQFFIDNANDEMKKCFDKLHSLKGSASNDN